ncbi:hypothetical protein [Streptomyces xantholiticus]|uniref:hypothetical protein n=1 Tax=Streptomyces xantholiticus TaxID=68285 RepID=UPI001678AC8A|nr:hypothetical protein [Streptomyces xantholiticus]GGW43498.1 hypothetical protein GCM10010381_30690 [Streptomyces xantholiticus]
MTSAALRPAADPRALRRAVYGRRMLRVLLFLGGVLTLGLLLGAPAYAAESGAGSTAEVRAEARQKSGADATVASRSTGSQAPASASTAPGSTKSAPSDGASPRVDSATSAERPAERELRRAADESMSAVEAAAAAGTARTAEAVRAVTRPVTDGMGWLTGLPAGIIAGPLPGGHLPAPGVVVPGDLPAAQLAPGGAPFTSAGTAPAVGGARSSADAGQPALVGIDRDCGAQGGGFGTARLVSAKSPVHTPAPGPVDPRKHQQGAVQQSSETQAPRPGDQPAATFADVSPDASASGPGCPAAEPPTRDRPRDVLEFPG